ncbi:hypothetical protein GF354_00505 [Candidatus Peregrinibacteria bacterium]|nr:hypothetical protein [Candidatus Peregrinibacteria bacterium]
MPEKKKEKKSNFGQTLISWKAPEYLQQEKGLIWKIIAILFVIGAIAFGFLTNGWTFSLAILAFSLVYYFFYLKKKPNIIEISITTHGIKFGTKKIPFTRITGFWFIYEPPHVKTFNISVTGEMINTYTFQLLDLNPEDIRILLKNKITEKKDKSEPLGDIILRNLKI